MNNLSDLKKTYIKIKQLGEDERINFLESIIAYCKCIGFDKEKTRTMLDLIRNIIPESGQKFTDCSFYDDIDIKFNESLDKKFEE